jgi:hypothetical protein
VFVFVWQQRTRNGPGSRVIVPWSCNRIAEFPAKCSNLAHRRDRDALLMVHNQATNFRNLAAQFVLGSIALALVTLACFGLHVDLTPTAFACLIAIVGKSHHPKRDEHGE